MGPPRVQEGAQPGSELPRCARPIQGEYYHHDGCSGPTKPRVVEIRFPHQAVPRQVATAVAPFRQVLHAMLELSSGQLGSDAELERWRDHLRREGELPSEKHDAIQGRITRALRRELDAESARAFYREVDDAALAYRAPWQIASGYGPPREYAAPSGLPSATRRWSGERQPGQKVARGRTALARVGASTPTAGVTTHRRSPTRRGPRS
jgi:hypothetical protein